MDHHQPDQWRDIQDSIDKRPQLEEQIFQEVQEGNSHSPMALYQAVSYELKNISDQALAIMMKQKRSFNENEYEE